MPYFLITTGEVSMFENIINSAVKQTKVSFVAFVLSSLLLNSTTVYSADACEWVQIEKSRIIRAEVDYALEYPGTWGSVLFCAGVANSGNHTQSKQENDFKGCLALACLFNLKECDNVAGDGIKLVQYEDSVKQVARKYSCTY